MALTDKLKAIANAIRSKTGKEELMTLAEMPDEIASISGGDGGYPVMTVSNHLERGIVFDFTYPVMTVEVRDE